MGIEQIGIRKKILDTIRDTHKKNWETSSLASIQYNKKIRYVPSLRDTGLRGCLVTFTWH